MSHNFQLGRRPRGGNDVFLPASDQDEDLEEFEEIEDDEEEIMEEEDALDEELNFDKPHFRRLGLDYEEEDEE